MIGGKRRGGDRRRVCARRRIPDRRSACGPLRRVYDVVCRNGRRVYDRRLHALDRRKEWTSEPDAVLVPGDLFDRIQEFVGDFCGEGEDAGVTEREANDLAGLLKMLRR